MNDKDGQSPTAEKGVDNVGFEIELDSKSNSAVEVLPVKARPSTISLSSTTDDDGREDQQEFKYLGKSAGELWRFMRYEKKRRNFLIKTAFYVILALLYNAYFVATVWYAVHNGIPIDFCDGVGFHIILTLLVYVGLFYFQIVKRFWGKAIYRSVMKPIGNGFDRVWKYRVSRYAFFLVIIALLATFLILDTASERARLRSFAGIFIFILLCWIFSKYPFRVIWRHVVWGVSLQFIFGLVVLRWPTGQSIIQCLGDKVTIFLGYTDAGSSFVYGYLVSDQNAAGISLGTIFAFDILSVIFFFSFFVNILYYYGAMQWVVEKIGWLLQTSIGTTAAESMNAAANIFLGQTEAPLLIRPFLGKMTKSELHAVMTGGFATIAGTVLAAYISFGISASQLVSASVMAAPAALALSKLLYPETEESQTKAGDIKVPKGTESNALDAAAQGAANAVFLVFNIIANLIAFLAFIAFLNGVISWYGDLLGAPYITFEWIMGKLFIPIAWIMGVEWSECSLVANLVALKCIVNEFAAYSKLSEYINQGLISKRSETIATFALCGFANPGSIGTQIAALSTMAPERGADLAKVAIRAFIAGTTASFLNACVAGTLVSTIIDDGGLSSTIASTTYYPSTLTFTPNVTAMMLTR